MAEHPAFPPLARPRSRPSIPMEASPPYQARPYRSKRHRPCDVCRRRKQACTLDENPPCRVCRELGTECTFNEPPSKRLRTEQQQRVYTPSSIAHSSSAYSRPSLRVQSSRHGDPPTDVECADEAISDNANSSHDERPDGRRDHTRSGGGGDGGGENGDGITANPVWTHGASYSTSSTTQVRGMGIGNAVEPQVDSLGLLGECDVGPQMLHPVQHDMWYLASLWDSNLSDSALQPMVNGFAGDVNGNYHQEGLFGMLDENPQPTNPPESEQARPQRNSVPKTTTAPDVDSRVQLARSLDTPDQGFSAQYIGLSGDIDPYLLQHARFSDDGTCDFGQFQYRQVTCNSPAEGYFVISPAKQSEDSVTRPVPEHSTEMNLLEMISPEIGSRLVGLLVNIPAYLLSSPGVKSRYHLRLPYPRVSFANILA